MKAWVANRNEPVAAPSGNAAFAALKLPVAGKQTTQRNGCVGIGEESTTDNDFHEGPDDLADSEHPPLRTNDFRHTYMEGDSYPETTSGALTEAESGDLNTITQSEMVTNPTPFVRQAEQDGPGFSFGRPAIAVPSKERRTVVVKAGERRQLVQQQPLPQELFRQKQDVLPQVNPQPANGQSGGDQRQKHHGHSPAAFLPTNAEQAMGGRKRRLIEDATVQSAQPDKQHEPPSEEPESIFPPETLDYDLRTLLSMKYTELQAQPFDQDPAVRAPSKDLAGLVDEFMSAEVDDHDAILEAMTSKQWEQAGERIAKEISDAITELQAIRRKKREASQNFEAEIDVWQQSTTTKLKSINAAADHLKDGGTNLLLLPPQKP